MYLGIDIGTGSLKAMVVADDGSVVASAKESYDTLDLSAATADVDPLIWWEVGRRAVRRLTASVGPSIDAVAVTGQMHGIVLTDADGSPVREAILWPDQRAHSVLDVFHAFHEDNPSTLGNPIVSGMAGPILVWLARNEPEALARATNVVQPKDWFRMQLCRGGVVTDPSDASATLLYDVVADGWSDTACEAVGVSRDLLPPIQPSASVAGTVDSSVAEELNLRSGIPVAVGAGDAPAALLGAGIEDTGQMLLNSGTGAQAITPLAAPTISDAPAMGLHQYRSASDSVRWYGMAAVVNGGLALDWVRQQVRCEWDDVYAGVSQVLSAPYPDDPVFVPFLNRERDPDLGHSSAGWTGLRLSHDRDALVRSAVRGVASYIGARTRELMERTEVDSLVVAGGASRHRQWVELLATVLGREVRTASAHHLTVRGAAVLAGRAVNHHLPVVPAGDTVGPRAGVQIGTTHFETVPTAASAQSSA
ncbi:MAG: FGGY family carbohydrate kinase [Nitriliruptorales bacterium]|nr:FGGY family carbohydrate kinase [Nitriliruptorales bacterium]